MFRATLNTLKGDFMGKSLKMRIALLLVIAALVSIPPAANSAPKPGSQAVSAATTASSTRVTQLLSASGYNFKQVTATVWSIDFTGKALSKFKVILATQDDLLVVFVTVAEKKSIPLSADFMMKLLRFDHSLDRVKVGIDDDGDAFVRVDLTVRVLDGQEFKLNVEQIAAAANEVYAGIQTSLVN
jgi:hypothetical protein